MFEFKTSLLSPIWLNDIFPFIATTIAVAIIITITICLVRKELKNEKNK